MIGATLQSMLNLLRVETRRSLNPAHNNDTRDSDVAMLQAKQEQLWDEHAWPHLRDERTIQLQAGQRFYGPPASDLRLDRLLDLEIKFGGVWYSLDKSIGKAEFSLYDSDLDERSWPVERWQIAENPVGGAAEIEVWPVPSDTGNEDDLEGYMRATGIRSLNPLAADDDEADLDNLLIVYAVAAEQLAADGAKNAQVVADKAAKRLLALTSNWTPRRQFRLYGDITPRGRNLRGPPTVYQRPSS